MDSGFNSSLPIVDRIRVLIGFSKSEVLFESIYACLSSICDNYSREITFLRNRIFELENTIVNSKKIK